MPRTALAVLVKLADMSDQQVCASIHTYRRCENHAKRASLASAALSALRDQTFQTITPLAGASYPWWCEEVRWLASLRCVRFVADSLAGYARQAGGL